MKWMFVGIFFVLVYAPPLMWYFFYFFIIFFSGDILYWFPRVDDGEN